MTPTELIEHYEDCKIAETDDCPLCIKAEKLKCKHCGDKYIDHSDGGYCLHDDDCEEFVPEKI